MGNDSRKAAYEDHLLSALPDAMLPSQSSNWLAHRNFERAALMLAVLADAINVLGDHRVSPNRRKRKSFYEAWSWVFAKGITTPLSFDHVCNALGVDAESLRRRLSELVAGHGGTLLRLRLKEGGRMQCLNVNRVRRRTRRAHQVGSSRAS